MCITHTHSHTHTQENKLCVTVSRTHTHTHTHSHTHEKVFLKKLFPSEIRVSTKDTRVRIHKVVNQLDVTTLLTPDHIHLLCFDFVCQWVVQVERWSPRVSSWNFLQPQDESNVPVTTEIWGPKKPKYVRNVSVGRYISLPDDSVRNWGFRL